MTLIDPIEIRQARPASPGRIKIVRRDWDVLRAHLLSDGSEHAAALVCGLHRRRDGVDLLVQSVVPFNDEDYISSGALHLSIAPRSLARVIKAARVAHASVVLCHSHPFTGDVNASSIDLRTETELCGRVFPGRLDGLPSAALVVGPNGLDGRVWTADGASSLTDVVVIGDHIERHACSSIGVVGQVASPTASPLDAATSRQSLLWGRTGQEILRRAHVTVVGCGGTGSHIASQLAHLRVGRLSLVDSDVVEESNLSRLVGSTPDDIGSPKAVVLARHTRSINPQLKTESIRASVLDIDARVLAESDVIVCATDGHGSRALLTELSQQYLTPVVDLGVEVDPAADTFRAGGGVRVLRPGRGCLHCARTLSPALVREEYLDDIERDVERARGYLRSVAEPAPSVIALNGVVASLAVLEVCQLLVGMMNSGRDRLLFRAEARALSTAALPSENECFVCGLHGLLGTGDSRNLPTRWRASTRSG